MPIVDADIIWILFSKVHIGVSSDGSWNNHGETSQNLLRERSFRTAGPEAAVVSKAATHSEGRHITVWTWWSAVFTARIYTILGSKSLMNVNIEGLFVDAAGDSHAGSSHMCKRLLTQLNSCRT